MTSATALYARAHYHSSQGDWATARSLLEQAVAMAPDNSMFRARLAMALHQQGDIDGAIAAYEAALDIPPVTALTLNNLGLLYHVKGRHEESVMLYRWLLDTDPRCADAWSNLGVALQALRRMCDARDALRKAIEIRPSFSDAHNNLGNVLLDMGMVDDALECFDDALQADPRHRNARLNREFARMYITDDADFAHCSAIDAAKAVTAGTPVYEHRGKRLRVRPKLGFVSGDFRSHPVGLMIAPTVERLAKMGFDLTFYTTTPAADAVTDRLRACGAWVEAFRLQDPELAQRIVDDQIDILFDCAGFTSGNRLEVFAAKPAPIQVAWFAYPGTTGLPQMDYVIGESVQMDGLEGCFTEKVILLPSIVAVEPVDSMPGPLPCEANGHITFGSFNVLKKITPQVVELWAGILRNVRDSRLLIKTPALDCPVTRARYVAMFGKLGITDDRLTMMGYTDRAGHQAAMGQVDIALDTFPYSGGVTTVECLQAGVPVITMPGQSYSSRHSAAYLKAIGLDWLVCVNEIGYAAWARKMAEPQWREKLDNLRKAFPLMFKYAIRMEPDSHARAMADALMEMWSQYDR